MKTCKLTWVLICHGARLLNKINLEANKELHLATRYPRDGYHGKKVHKRLASSSVIDQANLCLGGCTDGVLQVENRIVVTIVSLDSSFDFPVRGLQKPTVPTEDHVSGVTGKALEVFRAVDDWAIVHFCVAHNKSTRQVD